MIVFLFLYHQLRLIYEFSFFIFYIEKNINFFSIQSNKVKTLGLFDIFLLSFIPESMDVL